MISGLNGKTAFVAGASRGLGRAVAEALAAEGCNLQLVARSGEDLARLCHGLHTSHGIQAQYLACDLASAEGIAHAITETEGRFGGVDVLVTNNGGPAPGAFLDTDEDAWIDGWNRTLMNAVRLIRGFLPGMIERRAGRIIAITSISVRQPIPRLLLSNAYRAAVTGMLKTLSDEVAMHGITVNAIAPGYIETDRLVHLFADRAGQKGISPADERALTMATVPARRLGRPEEVGALAAFLASEQAAYITGSTILIDGGLHRGVF